MGDDSPERLDLDPDSVVDLAAAPDEPENAADVAVTCAVAGLAIEHAARQSMDDER